MYCLYVSKETVSKIENRKRREWGVRSVKQFKSLALKQKKKIKKKGFLRPESLFLSPYPLFKVLYLV